MLSLMSQVLASVLLSASTFTNPTNPKALSFDASAYVTSANQIRVAVKKSTDASVSVLLWSTDKQVLFRRTLSKKESAYAVKLDVNELADGQYELEIVSNEGSIRKQFNVSTAPTQKAVRVVAVQ